MNGLHVISKQVKRSADKLLQESNLKEILSIYGEVVIGGSYALDAMLRPDLDVYVLGENDNEDKLKEVVNTIISSHYFDELWIVDWVSKEGGKIKGYYLQPHKTLDGLDWKLDIWLMKNSEYKPVFPQFVELLKQEQDSKKRELILELKNKYKEGTKYQKGIDGNLIYEAVLEKNIKSIKEFEEYLTSLKSS